MAIEPVNDSDPTIGRLVTDATRDISALINKEIQLAKSELKVSVRAGGTGVGLFAAAAFLVLLAIVMFSMALAYLIHWNGDGLDLQWAFLLVFVIYLLLAALLGYLGYRKVQKVRGPEKAIAEAQKTKAALTTRGG
jgi:ABC-type multidrug transport system permease subunit